MHYNIVSIYLKTKYIQESIGTTFFFILIKGKLGHINFITIKTNWVSS